MVPTVIAMVAVIPRAKKRDKRDVSSEITNTDVHAKQHDIYYFVSLK